MLLQGLDTGHDAIAVAPLPEDLVTENELVLVLDYTHGHTQFHRRARSRLSGPFAIQRVCGSNTEKIFLSCGIVSPFSRRRSTGSRKRWA